MKYIFLSILAVYTILASAEPTLIFADGSTAEVKWLKGPALIPEESVVQIHWKSSMGRPSPTLKTIQVEFLMPEHGHGTSPVAVTEIGPGQFKVSEIYLTMPGHWQLALTVVSPSGTSETQILDLPLSIKDLRGCSK